MAQAGFTPIQLYYSTTASAVPTAGNLASGELAINISDGKLYYKNASNVVTLLATAGSVSSQWVTSGSNIYYNTGNVGIGTSSPATKFQVSAGRTTLSANNENFALQLNNGSTTNGPYLGSSGLDTLVVSASSGAERMRLDSSGNLGLGVTPSAWATAKALDVLTDGGAVFSFTRNLGVASNAFWNGTNWIYKSTGFATRYESNSGGSTGNHVWSIAPSGTAGNTISFTQAMTLDASGNLGVGTTSPESILHVAKASSGGLGAQVILDNTATSALNNAVEISFLTDVGASGSGTRNARIRAVNENAANGNANLQFWTWNGATDAERARITSGGAVLVGTTSGAYTGAGCVNSQVSTSGDFCFSGVNTNSTNPRGLYLRNPNTTGGDFAIFLEASAVTKFYVNGNGVIYSTNTSVQAISDVRHKENVRDLDKGLAEVLALKPRRFDWKEGKGTGAKDVAGFIAQEVEAVLPELVGEWKESVDAEETFKSIGMANVIPMLVKAIQELNAKVESLTTELNALKGT